MSGDEPIDAVVRQLGRERAARKTAEALLEHKSLELYRANCELQALYANLKQQASAQLQESEARYQKLVELMPGAIWVHTEGRLVFLNDAAVRLLGASSAEEMLGTSIPDLVVPEQCERIAELNRQVLDQQVAPEPFVVKVLRRDGTQLEVEWVSTAIQFQLAASVLTAVHDITERRSHEAALEYQATHDLLTGLPNRILFRDRLVQAIRHAERHAARLAVLFVDLDKFKYINDSLGHGAGDELLNITACRLQTCLRDCDTIARLGGDEFVLLAQDLTENTASAHLARRVIAALSEPVTLAGQEHSITCSVGISNYPDDGGDADALLKQADIAMYRAKERGRNNYQFFTAELQKQLNERLNLELQLRRALERNEFVLHYQPQVDLRTGQIIGLEALFRWQSPEQGLVYPGRLIRVAEESDLILAIGEWVLRTACAQSKAWQRSGLRPVPVAVNVAASQFARAGFDLLVHDALQTNALDPRYLELELTESLPMDDPEHAIDILRRLKKIGVSLVIDDFGTGYSNLSYLKHFPIDKLKIDQSFIAGLTNDPEDHAITTAVIQLAHSLGLRAVAEGVETEGQLRLLAEGRCDEIQGYYFRPPAPTAQIAELLERNDRLDLSRVDRRRHNRTVLLVDDDPRDRSNFRRLLRNTEVQLLVATSTTEAYEILACQEVGVVVADYRMPREDGIAFCTRIRQLYPRAVRILMTAHDDPRTLAGAINHGEIFRFVSKPWSAPHVMETLRQAFERYEG
jgi:diguanylate cyclase (GGDEF)-like protein/PAS domain S-box-containing protein